MKFDFEKASYSITNIFDQLENIFGDKSDSITYSIVDENGNVKNISVDTWKKLKSEIRTDLKPLKDIEDKLKEYINLVDSVKDIKGIPSEDELNKNSLAISEDTKGIYTKNKVDSISRSFNKEIIEDNLKGIIKKGEQFIFGNGEPSDDIGYENALYIDLNIGSLWIKNSNGWGSIVDTTENTETANLKKTETPKLSGVTNMNEMSTKVFTITNFNPNYAYNINVSSGTAKLDISNGHITYSSDSVESDTNVKIEVYAQGPNMTQSDPGTYTFTVFNIPTTSDQAIIDNNFSSNADIINGIQF